MKKVWFENRNCGGRSKPSQLCEIYYVYCGRLWRVKSKNLDYEVAKKRIVREFSQCKCIFFKIYPRI